jgi:thiol-disulfide isomerase/thioredoxin
MITELNEDTVKDFIKQDKVVIDYWLSNCPNCNEFADTFKKVSEVNKEYKFGKLFFDREKAESSEFRRTYLKTAKGEKVHFPVTLIFEKGELKNKFAGLLDEENFIKFLGGDKPTESQQSKDEKYMGKFARKGWLVTQIQKFTEELRILDEELMHV